MQNIVQDQTTDTVRSLHAMAKAELRDYHMTAPMRAPVGTTPRAPPKNIVNVGYDTNAELTRMTAAQIARTMDDEKLAQGNLWFRNGSVGDPKRAYDD